MPRWIISPKLCTNLATLCNTRLPSTIRCVSTEEAQLAKKMQKMWMGNDESSLRSQKIKSTPQEHASNVNANFNGNYGNYALTIEIISRHQKKSTPLLPPERRDRGTPGPCFRPKGPIVTGFFEKDSEAHTQEGAKVS